MVSPRARVTVGLQFLHHRQAASFRFAHSLPQRHGLVQRPGQILDVMTDFVSESRMPGRPHGEARQRRVGRQP
jgi:hypothetical protein